MTDSRKLIGNIMSLFTLQGANYILPLITLPYLVRVLGPERLGLIAFSQAFIQYFVVITDYGFNLSATRDISKNKNKKDIINEITSAVIIIKSSLCIIGIIAILLITTYIKNFHNNQTLYMVVYITVIGSTAFPLWLFQGLQRMKQITILTIIARIITTASIFIFIKDKNDYIYAAFIQSSTMMIAAIPAWFLILKENNHAIIIPKFEAIREQLKYGWHIFISTSAINIYTNSNIFVLGLTTSPDLVAYYSVANKIIGAILGLFQPIVTGLYPHVSTLTTQSKSLARSFTKKISPFFLLFGATLSVITYLFSPVIINIVAGNQYYSSIDILKFLSPLPLLIAIGLIYGALTMLPFGMEKPFSRITIIGAIIDISSIYPLTHYYAANGAAIANVLTEIFISIAMIIYVSKQHKKRRVL